MTTVKISVHDWEIPDMLKKIEQNTEQANSLMQENKILFEKVASVQRSLKETCESVIKTQM